MGLISPKVQRWVRMRWTLISCITLQGKLHLITVTQVINHLFLILSLISLNLVVPLPLGLRVDLHLSVLHYHGSPSFITLALLFLSICQIYLSETLICSCVLPSAFDRRGKTRNLHNYGKIVGHLFFLKLLQWLNYLINIKNLTI